MKKYTFSCGCSFPIIGDPISEGAIPLLEVDPSNFPSCDKAWEIFSRGDTKGVFQLESDLGKQWSKKLRPKNIEHLSALVALIRPGSLRALSQDGISMTAHYCKRANFEEPVESYHPIVDEVLKETFGSLVFQEQSMELSKRIAGFSLQEADVLRKSMGKKSASNMAKCKKIFIEGAKKSGHVSDKEAEDIFGWIEQSQNYSFNKSHACSYALIGYDTAYIKSHFPVHFYTSWLFYAKDKADSQTEIFELVEEAKNFNILVQCPDMLNMHNNFTTNGVSIWFGVTNVKGIGVSQYEKMEKEISENKPSSWEEFVVKNSDNIPKSTIEKLISVNFFKCFGTNRRIFLAEFEAWNNLTEKERKWIKEKLPITTIPDMITKCARPKADGGGCSSVKRVDVLKSLVDSIINPPSPLRDVPSWICSAERDLLGISLSYNLTDFCDTSGSNSTCKEYNDGKNGPMIFGVEIRTAKEITTKAGSNMCFLSISDSTGKIGDVICFPKVYKDVFSLLKEGNTVLIYGERDKKSSSLLVNKVVQI